MKCEIVLDLGCGRKKHQGAIGTDNVKMTGIDMVVDLERGFPFMNDSIDSIIMHHSLEHMKNFMYVVSEVHRVLRKGGKADIRVPYCMSFNAFDPMHKIFFTEQTFDYYFSKNSQFNYYRDNDMKIMFIINKELVINPLTMNRILEFLIPKSLLKRLVFDAYNEVHFELEKI
jgi:SAM-dependent methyltransferase